MCNTCNTALSEGKLTCPDCGERVAENAHREKLNALNANTATILKNNFGHPFFLVSAIGLSVILFAQTILGFTTLSNAFSNLSDWLYYAENSWGFHTEEVAAAALGSFVVNLLSALYTFAIMVPPLLSVIGAWQIFASSKQNAFNPKLICRVRAYSTLQTVLNLICAILVPIAILIVVAIAFFNFDGVLETLYESGVMSLPDLYELEDIFEDTNALGFIIFLVIGLIAIVISLASYILSCITFGRISGYYTRLSILTEKGVYATKKSAPAVLPFIVAGFLTLGMLFSLIVSPTSSLMTLGVIAYLVMSALLFPKIHKEISENLEAIAEETAQLEAVKKMTDEQQREDASKTETAE